MNATEIASAAEAVDHVAPLNEATLMALAAGDPSRIDLSSEDAVAIAFGDAPVEIVVDPTVRRQGRGRELIDQLLAAGETQFWAHGDLPGAHALAAAAGLRTERTLLVLRRDVSPVQDCPAPDGVTIRPSTPADVDGVVAVNGRAFATHPEQGAMDRADFERRASAAWFDWAGLFVAEHAGAVVGFHWTKIDPSTGSGQGAGIGEVYVVGVDPDQQGTGLGTALTARGLQHLIAADVSAINLYVEGDNAPALAVYQRLGFVEHARDVLYGFPSGGGSATE